MREALRPQRTLHLAHLPQQQTLDLHCWLESPDSLEGPHPGKWKNPRGATEGSKISNNNNNDNNK